VTEQASREPATPHAVERYGEVEPEPVTNQASRDPETPHAIERYGARRRAANLLGTLRLAGPGGDSGAVAHGDVYLMSPPGRDWAIRGRANFRSQEAAPVSPLRARKEWLALAEAIEETGATVVVLPPVPELSGMPYAAEAGHVLPPRASGGRPRFLLPRMAAAHRARERDHWGPLAARLGFEVIDIGEGIWEAQGDVASFEGTMLLFHGGRTDRPGLTAALQHFDGELLVLELRQPAFHGNMAVLPLPAAGRMLVCQEVLVGDGLERLIERFGGARLEPVSEEEIRSYATNGLPISKRWLAPSVVPRRVKARVAALGMEVVELSMRELCEKAGGASRCLVCHAPGVLGALTIPEANRLAPTREQILAEPDDG
jgi:N-dimethylarginine dimethylaminohydrolase